MPPAAIAAPKGHIGGIDLQEFDQSISPILVLLYSAHQQFLPLFLVLKGTGNRINSPNGHSQGLVSES